MSMLAERRSKQKWSADPNNTNWSKDTSKFGSRMMEKMGWTLGKGLGANEDGRTEHIKVAKKNDMRGVGCSAKEVHNWVAHQDDFTNLLAQLNDHHSEASDSTKDDEEHSFPTSFKKPLPSAAYIQGIASLEERSKSQKRVHYHKFARGKDLSNYRKSDLDAIFGKSSSKSAPATPADSSDTNESGEDSASSCPDKGGIKKTKKCKGKINQNAQSNQVTSSLSVQEYFSKRMSIIKKKQGNGNVQKEDFTNESKSKETIENGQVMSSVSVQEYFSQKMAKMKKRKTEQSATSTNNREEISEAKPVLVVGDTVSIDSTTSESIKGSKKKKKKDKTDKITGSADRMDSSNIYVKPNEGTEDDHITNKKKSKKRKKSKIDDEEENKSRTKKKRKE